MKRLIILTTIVVMSMSSGALAGGYPVASVLNGGLGYSCYGGGYYGGGYYGGGYYGNSDAGKMIAAGRLVRDIAGAATSLKSTWEAWGLTRREQEYRNQRRVQPAQVVYPTPSVNQGMIAKNTNLQRENQMLKQKIEQEKAREIQALSQRLEKVENKNKALQEKLTEVKQESQTKQAEVQKTSAENQKLQERIKELDKKLKELQERKKLQKTLDDLKNEIQKLESPADPNS